MRDHCDSCAVFLAEGSELHIVWANDDYLALLGEHANSEGVIGRVFEEVSALGPVRADALREVIRTGEMQTGVDRTFNIKDGTAIHEWRAYRPLPDHVLVVIISKSGTDEERG